VKHFTVSAFPFLGTARCVHGEGEV